MNYKKAYEEALERAKELHDKHPLGEPPTWTICEQIFPELRESEDEKIRKEIIDFLRLPHPQFVGKRDHEEWISWLEKQKETKLTGEEVDDIFQQGQDSVVDNPEKYGLQKKCEWSEEDEEMRKGIITTLKANINRLYLYDAQGKADHEAKISWLKSLNS